MFKQAERRAGDGEVGVERHAEGMLQLRVEQDGKYGTLRVSEYNAARLVGGLCLLLGIKLAPQDARSLKM